MFFLLPHVQDVAEMTAMDARNKPTKSQKVQDVEDAVARALKEGGAQVVQNVIVGNCHLVGVLMGSSTVKRGVAIELLDEVGVSLMHVLIFYCPADRCCTAG